LSIACKLQRVVRFVFNMAGSDPSIITISLQSERLRSDGLDDPVAEIPVSGLPTHSSRIIGVATYR
jgi:hypothetical protein